MKYLFFGLLILALLGGIGTSFFFWQSSRANARLLAAKNAELQKANLEIGRAKTVIAKQKDIHSKAIRDLNKEISSEIKARKAAVTMYSQLEAKHTVLKKVKAKTKIVYRDRQVNKVVKSIVNLPKGRLFVRRDDGTYNEVTSIQYGYKDFRITLTGDAIKETLSYKLHQKFLVRLVETKLPTGGKNHYAEIYELDDKGKRTKLKLNKFEVLRASDSPSRMFWWNPKLDLHVGFGISSGIAFKFLGELGLSISGYGKTPNDLTWRFFRLGAGATPDGFSLSLSPVQFNIGKFLPLISNSWLTPYAGWNFNGRYVHGGLGLSVVF